MKYTSDRIYNSSQEIRNINMKTFKVNVEMTINMTEEDVIDIMVTALEGGIGYWACLDNTSERYKNAPIDETTSETAARILIDGGTVIFYDEEDDDRPLELTIEKLSQGVGLLVERGYDEYGAILEDGTIDCGEIDAEIADYIIQLALFDDVIYG